MILLDYPWNAGPGEEWSLADETGTGRVFDDHSVGRPESDEPAVRSKQKVLLNPREKTLQNIVWICDVPDPSGHRFPISAVGIYAFGPVPILYRRGSVLHVGGGCELGSIPYECIDQLASTEGPLKRWSVGAVNAGGEWEVGVFGGKPVLHVSWDSYSGVHRTSETPGRIVQAASFRME